MEENEKAVAAMRQFLEALGLDLQALGMEKTPHRVAQAFGEFFSGLRENPDDEWQAPIATQSDGLVVVRNIRFQARPRYYAVGIQRKQLQFQVYYRVCVAARHLSQLLDPLRVKEVLIEFQPKISFFISHRRSQPL